MNKPWSIRAIVVRMVALLAIGAGGSFQEAAAQVPATSKPSADIYGTSNCMGCHGQTAMGGLGPPLAQTKLSLDEVMKMVRNGKGMMPATTTAQASDEEIQTIYSELRSKPWDESQIPIAFKVGQFLTARNVSHIFLAVFLFAFIFAIKGLLYWLRCAGIQELRPAIKKFGYGKALGVTLRALVVDGFFVSSLWRKSRFRWAMHGLMLYGFSGLILADALMAWLNPTRAELPLTNPLKLLPVLSGVAVLSGVFFVTYRYKRDDYIDNGLTVGRDFAFVNLLLQTIVSGLMVLLINRSASHGWVMPIYLYHLTCIALLIATAPFTRFQHAYVVPALVAITRLTEELIKSGVYIGFRREPSPGRHHKSEKIAKSVMAALGPEYEGEIRLRYYP